MATTQAICDYRREQGYDGPLFVGRDTHALSEPAWATALEVLVANDVTVLVDDRDGYTPTPAVCHAILRANQGRTTGAGLADGIVVTPSHNPPTDGGFKYNPPHGGPADSDATSVIAARANELIRGRHRGRAPRAVRQGARRGRVATTSSAPTSTTCRRCSTSTRSARPASASAPTRWAGRASPTGARSPTGTGLDLTVVNPLVDPTWRFMTLDWDGKIRMDCSSPSAMASLIGRKDDYDIATGNDADADRHGIVTPDAGLMNPNHFLAVAIGYLFGGARPDWPATRADRQDPGVELDDRPGRRLDRQAAGRGAGRLQVVRARADRRVVRLRRRGVGGRLVPAPRRLDLDHRQGRPPARAAGQRDPRRDRADAQPALRRAGRPARRPGVRPHRRPGRPRAEGQARRAVARRRRRDRRWPGRTITAKLTEAPGNGAKIGGLKVTTESAWFAARPSGTEDVYKIYAESFRGPDHLAQVQDEAREVVSAALR